MDSADKKQVNVLIPKAKDALVSCAIVEDGKIKKAWRSQVSALGAAITMGSLQAAVAMYSKQGNADVNRPKLLRAIERTLSLETGTLVSQIDAARNNAHQLHSLKRKVVNSAVALKLAMNLFDLTEEQGDADE